MILQAIWWALLVSLAGWLTFPILFVLFPGLSERGYGLARSAGLLTWGYLYWLGLSLGVLENGAGAVLVSLLVVAGLSIALAWRRREALLNWLRANQTHMLIVEIVFFLAFAGMALLRAANPDVVGTEKPMELAFINAILRSETFPPMDPWLSGYAISYYYFGYVMTAMLAQLAMVPGSVAFNLMLATVFAMTAAGVYGLAVNLLAHGQETIRGWTRGLALLAPLMVLVVSNFGGVMEVLHGSGVFWETAPDGTLTSDFWTGLNIRDWDTPPDQPFSPDPDRYYWWWRSSRVIVDQSLTNDDLEIIDEFPFFSYLLGDLHPHVLSMPFFFLAIGLALNVFYGGGRGNLKIGPWQPGLHPLTLIAAILSLGGMAFLNTWDFPVTVALFVAAYGLWQAGQLGWSRDLLLRVVLVGLITGVGGVLAYLPFYIGFSSQAGGLIPNLIYATSTAQIWIHFGLLWLPILLYLLVIWLSHPDRRSVLTGLGLTLAGMLALALLSLLAGVIAASLPQIGLLYLGTMGGGGLQDALVVGALRRISESGTLLTLFVVIGLPLGLLLSLGRQPAPAEEEPVEPAPAPGFHGSMHAFILLLIMVGGLLVLAPEFFYLRDQFGWRINSIFKFYYQAWLLWGLAAGTGLAWLLLRAPLWSQLVAGLVFLISFGSGLVYPVYGVREQTNEFAPVNGWSLDGAAFLSRDRPEEAEAIAWLSQAPLGTVAESVGGSYTIYARMATFSGQPNVLGWPGHESQWRGGAEEMGSRESDIRRLYCTSDWEEARLIIDRYGIRYVVVGVWELTAYGSGTPDCPRGVMPEKFTDHLVPVFTASTTVIYQVP